MSSTKLIGIEGKSGNRLVLIGFEKANVLFNLSFADVLDEDSRKGYQGGLMIGIALISGNIFKNQTARQYH